MGQEQSCKSHDGTSTTNNANQSSNHSKTKNEEKQSAHKSQQEKSSSTTVANNRHSQSTSNKLGWPAANNDCYEPIKIAFNKRAICQFVSVPDFGAVATFGMF